MKHAPTASGGSVQHQIIVNGFQNKSNAALTSGRGALTGTVSGLRAPLNVGRPKSGSGGSSNAKTSTQEHMTVSKSKNSTSGSINGTMGLMTSGGQSSSATDSQLRGGHQRKKQNQSAVGKISTYTTDKKGKTVRHDIHGSASNATPATQSAGPSSHGLNSMRNYSGSLQKAPMASSSIYKSQRGQYQYSKVSSRGIKPVGENVLHNARTVRQLGVSGTVASESTGLSRSNRSGEGERIGVLPPGGAPSSGSSSGIPLHPKLIHHKAAANHSNTNGRLLLPNQKGQTGGSLTQNQTPNPLSYSNSHSAINKHRQVYNSNQNSVEDAVRTRDSVEQKYESIERLDGSHQTGDRASAFEKMGSSSENDTS